jgi:hypothetical protein
VIKAYETRHGRNPVSVKHAQKPSKKQSVLLVTDISFLGRIKEQVADSSNQRINTKGEVGKEEVSQRSGGVALGLEAGVVDNDTADPAKEEGQQKTDEIIVVIVFHNKIPFVMFLIRFIKPSPSVHRKTR